MTKKLTIIQLSLIKSNYEIYDGDSLVASLHFFDRLFKIEGQATIGSQKWTFSSPTFSNDIVATPSSSGNSPLILNQEN